MLNKYFLISFSLSPASLLSSYFPPHFFFLSSRLVSPSSPSSSALLELDFWVSAIWAILSLSLSLSLKATPTTEQNTTLQKWALSLSLLLPLPGNPLRYFLQWVSLNFLFFFLGFFFSAWLQRIHFNRYL